MVSQFRFCLLCGVQNAVYDPSNETLNFKLPQLILFYYVNENILLHQFSVLYIHDVTSSGGYDVIISYVMDPGVDY